MRGRVPPAEVVPGWQAQKARQILFLPLIPRFDVMTLSRRWVFEIRSGAMVCVAMRGSAIPQDICGTPLLSHRSETPWEACPALRHRQAQLHVTPGEQLGKAVPTSSAPNPGIPSNTNTNTCQDGPVLLCMPEDTASVLRINLIFFNSWIICDSSCDTQTSPSSPRNLLQLLPCI